MINTITNVLPFRGKQNSGFKITWIKLVCIGLLILFNFLQVFACVGAPHRHDLELERNRELWKESQISEYSFEMIKSVGGQLGFAPVKVRVRDSELVSIVPIQEPGPLNSIDYTEFETVEKVFDRIQKSLDQGDRVKVIYNSEYGYPEQVLVSEIGKGTDTGFNLKITNFEAIVRE